MSLNERLKFAEMKARHQKVLIPWYKKWWGILIIILLALILITLVISTLIVIEKTKAILAERENSSLEQQAQNYAKTVNGDGTNYYLGSNNPEITIVEFGDFACSACHESSIALKNTIPDYSGKIKVIWRDYPVINENSVLLALAARCAGEQNKFWEYGELLFSNQSNFAATASSNEFGQLLDQLANEINLDIERFDNCLNNQSYILEVNKDHKDAEALEVAGTPTWFINGYYKISGGLNQQSLEDLINGLLK
jgi:protein-disulfide isomerase